MPTSVKSTGSQPVALSKTMCAEAMLARGRCSDPLKIMSSVFLPRKRAYDCSPSTQRRESAMFDFPEPLGPTIAVIPPANSKVVLDAKVLYPCSSSDFRRRGMCDLSDSIYRKGPVLQEQFAPQYAPRFVCSSHVPYRRSGPECAPRPR